MSGITSVNSISPVRPTSTPSVQTATPAPVSGAMAGDSMVGGSIRMAQPVAKFAWDKIASHFHPTPAPTPAPVVPSPVVVPPADVIKAGLRAEVGAGAGAVTSGIGNFFKSFGTAFKASLKSNFIVAAVVAGVSNVVDLAMGKTTPTKAAVTFAADTLAYTGIGATCSGLGAVLGTLIPVPFVGTAIGLAVGMGLGFLYEKMVRPQVASMVN